LLADWALCQPGVRVVSARVEPENTASVRLLRRLGFTTDGQSAQYLRYVLRGDRSAGSQG
jgi:RimJ/RimL family protein N-acetyltransferase